MYVFFSGKIILNVTEFTPESFSFYPNGLLFISFIKVINNRPCSTIILIYKLYIYNRPTFTQRENFSNFLLNPEINEIIFLTWV